MMVNGESNPQKPASEELLNQVEESLTAGPVRDLWLGVRAELAENGPGAVRTYLQSEFQRKTEHSRECTARIVSSVGRILPNA